MQKYFTKINLEEKSLNENGHFTGYASVFNSKDLEGDVILPGAFRRSLIENSNIKLLWQHEPSEPIGIIDDVSETTEGLFIKGKILANLSRGKEAYELIKSGAINGLSIGFQSIDSFDADGVRYIKELKLWEVSLVTFPANELAVIDNIKSLHSMSIALERARSAIKEI